MMEVPMPVRKSTIVGLLAYSLTFCSRQRGRSPSPPLSLIHTHAHNMLSALILRSLAPRSIFQFFVFVSQTVVNELLHERKRPHVETRFCSTDVDVAIITYSLSYIDCYWLSPPVVFYRLACFFVAQLLIFVLGSC